MPNPFYAAAAAEDPFAPTKCVGCNKDIFGQSNKIKALGKFWHKGCLKCSVCNFQLNPRNLESYQNTPYCKAHKPNPQATQTADRADIKRATSVPKASRRVQGVAKNARMTFAPGAFQKPEGEVIKAFGDKSASAPARAAPSYDNQDEDFGATYDAPTEDFNNLSVNDGYDEGGYDAGGYDEGGYAEEGYDEGYAEEGYAEEGYAEEGYDEGYAEEGYAEEGYDEGYYEEGYEEGYYEEGYEEGYDEGYAEEGYY